MNDITKEIINDIERDKLISFSQDKIMFEAVKKYVLFYVYQGVAEAGKPLTGNRNYALQLAWGRSAQIPRSNEELGADIRALARGVECVESGFKEISEIAPVKVEAIVEEPNKGL